MSQPIDMGELLEQVSRQMESAKANALVMTKIAGLGEAGEGTIKVTVGPTGRLSGIEFDPRVLRMDLAAISAGIVEAARLAEKDAQAQVSALWRDTDGSGGMDIGVVAMGDDTDTQMEVLEKRFAALRDKLTNG